MNWLPVEVFVYGVFADSIHVVALSSLQSREAFPERSVELLNSSAKVCHIA